MLCQTVAGHGLPLALYTDLHGIFVKDPDRGQTLAEQLAGQPSRTQVGRALDAAGIRWIGARSPQAKGRSERLWGTFQDRLVSELRREGVATIEDANTLLARHLPRHNRRFAVPAAEPGAAWRPWPDGPPPEAVFCFEYTRRVERDATIGWDGGALSLPRRTGGASWGRRRGHRPGTPRREPLDARRQRAVPAQPGTALHPDPAGSTPLPRPGAHFAAGTTPDAGGTGSLGRERVPAQA
jgi:hypothetical protein